MTYTKKQQEIGLLDVFLLFYTAVVHPQQVHQKMTRHLQCPNGSHIHSVLSQERKIDLGYSLALWFMN